MSSVASKRYAVAFWEIAQNDSNTKEINTQFLELSGVLADSKELISYLISPVVQADDKIRLVNSIFSKKINSNILRFVVFLIRKRRIALLQNILTEYQNLLDEESGKVSTEVISSDLLSAGQIEKIKQFLTQNFSKNISLINKMDKALIGGYQIKVGDLVIDQSVKNQMERLKKGLLAG